eukprot:3455551-Pyramimonas_sp.AAC.1
MPTQMPSPRASGRDGACSPAHRRQTLEAADSRLQERVLSGRPPFLAPTARSTLSPVTEWASPEAVCWS